MSTLADSLHRIMRQTMYAEAYAEAVAEFKIVKAWRDFREDPTAKITLRRPTKGQP